jgi:hypothetical protein
MRRGCSIFLIAVLGCGEGDAPCHQVRLLEPRYETESACIAATDAALMRALEEDYPVVVAQCQKVGQWPVIAPTDVRLPSPEKTSLFRS